MGKIVGISCSPRKDKFTSNLVQKVLEGTGKDTTFISLAGKTILPCTACLSCAGDNICKLEDDWAKFQDQLGGALALVIGGVNYYDQMNALTHAFMERFYAFRHQGNKVAGKPVLLAAVGCLEPEKALKGLEFFAQASEFKIMGNITCTSKELPCYVCGYGETCSISSAKKIHGEDVKITPELIPQWSQMVDVQAQALQVGKDLAAALG